jgi:site-specific DNA recombinase
VHPAAIERYLADIRRLAEVAAEAAELGEPELIATLRQLVQAVTVHGPPGTDELAIEIKASLSELTLPGPLLTQSSGGGGQVVAGEGLEPPTPGL